MIRSITNCDWFETYIDCVEENYTRISILNSSQREDAWILAEKLELCTEEIKRCNSAACKLCNHRYKVARCDEVVSKIKQSGFKWRVLTVIDYSRSVRREYLTDDITKKAKMRWGQTLRRCRVEGPVIGGVELDYHEECSMWLLHAHLLYPETEANIEPIREFRGRIKKQQPIHIKENRDAKPILKQPLRNPYRQVSYAYKLSSFRVLDYEDRIYKKNRTKKYRLNIPETADILCLMDHLGRRAFLFSYGEDAWR